MRYTHIVEIIDRFSYLPNYGSGLVLGQFSLLKFLVQSPSVHVLQNNEEVSLIIEETIHSQYISVV
jgi:hypothetical protein